MFRLILYRLFKSRAKAHHRNSGEEVITVLQDAITQRRSANAQTLMTEAREWDGERFNGAGDTGNKNYQRAVRYPKPQQVSAGWMGPLIPVVPIARLDVANPAR
jgi:hypothetical protein